MSSAPECTFVKIYDVKFSPLVVLPHHGSQKTPHKFLKSHQLLNEVPPKFIMLSFHLWWYSNLLGCVEKPHYYINLIPLIAFCFHSDDEKNHTSLHCHMGPCAEFHIKVIMPLHLWTTSISVRGHRKSHNYALPHRPPCKLLILKLSCLCASEQLHTIEDRKNPQKFVMPHQTPQQTFTKV